MNKILEIIAISLEDIKLINQSNADRIELCVDMKSGGVTPDFEMIKKACKLTQKPMRIMIRFNETYNLHNEEKCKIIEYLKYITSLNSPKIQGIVVGYLNEDKTLNNNILDTIYEYSNNLKITFHKASDILIENNSLNELNFNKIDTILTQGGTSNIIDNIDVLKKIIDSNLTNVLLGGGINSDNINTVLKLNTSIHLGSYARVNNSFSNKINIELINSIKNQMN